MKLTEIIREFRAAGTPAEQILKVVEEMAARQEADEAERAAARREAARNRQRIHRGTTTKAPVVVTVTARDSELQCVTLCDPSPPLDVPPSPPPAPPPLPPLNPPHPRSVVATRSGYPAEFEEWWKAYPPNDGSKKEAHKSYQKAIKAGVTHATLLESAQGYRRSIESRSDGRKFTAHAATWLNQSRWEVNYDGGESAFDRLYDELDRRTGAGNHALLEASHDRIW